MPIDYRQIENLPTFEDDSIFLLNDIRRKLKEREIRLTKAEEKWKLEKGSPAPSYFFGDAIKKVARLQAAVERAAARAARPAEVKAMEAEAMAIARAKMAARAPGAAPEAMAAEHWSRER